MKTKKKIKEPFGVFCGGHSTFCCWETWCCVVCRLCCTVCFVVYGDLDRRPSSQRHKYNTSTQPVQHKCLDCGRLSSLFGCYRPTGLGDASVFRPNRPNGVMYMSSWRTPPPWLADPPWLANPPWLADPPGWLPPPPQGWPPLPGMRSWWVVGALGLYAD